MILPRMWEVRLPLHRPLITGRFTIHERHVVYVHVRDTISGVEGWGEAAPLPAFGTESWDECLAALDQACNALAVGQCWDEVLSALGSTPAARCCMDMVRLDFLARESGKSLTEYLGGADPITDIPVNALITGKTVDSIVASAKQAVRDGYTCVKMKVGALSWQEDLDRVWAVQETLDSGILLRLDANGAWTRRQAERALEDLATLDIEYLEQPTTDATELTEIGKESKVPVAADESVTSPEVLARLCDTGGISVVVLKPMALGGLTVAADCARLAMGAGVDVVFTSFMDSALARTAVLHLAASFGVLCPRHHGLATGSLFQRDCNGPTPVQGRLALPSGWGIGVNPESIDFSSEPVRSSP